MDIFDLKTFVVVAKQENMTKAATITNQSISSVSRIINKIENITGNSLFERANNNHLLLTSAGRQFYNYALDAIEREEEIISKINPNSINSNKLYVGVENTASFSYLVEYIPEFDLIDPTTTFSLVCSDLDSILKMLDERKIDVAIINYNDLDTVKYRVIKSIENTMGLYASNEIYQNKEIDIGKLLREKFITPVRRNSIRKQIDSYLINNDISLNSSYEIDNPYLIAKKIYKYGYLGLLNKNFISRNNLEDKYIRIDLPELEVRFTTSIITNNYYVQKDIVNDFDLFVNNNKI